MSPSETYNGWTNYPTWRIMIEVFDCMELDHQVDHEWCERQVLELIEMDCNITKLCNRLTISYAQAFISPVNWHEIAKAVNEYNKERVK